MNAKLHFIDHAGSIGDSKASHGGHCSDQIRNRRSSVQLLLKHTPASFTQFSLLQLDCSADFLQLGSKGIFATKTALNHYIKATLDVIHRLITDGVCEQLLHFRIGGDLIRLETSCAHILVLK